MRYIIGKKVFQYRIYNKMLTGILCFIICVLLTISLVVCVKAPFVKATSGTTETVKKENDNPAAEESVSEQQFATQDNAGETTTIQESSDNDSSIQDLKREHELVKKEADANLGTARKLALEIREMNLRLSDEARLIEKTHNELAELDVKIADVERSLIEYEEELAVEKDHLYNSIRMEYEDGNRSPLSIFLNMDQFSDIADNLEYSQRISGYLNDRMSAYEFMMEFVSKNRDDLNELKKQREEELLVYDKKKAGFKKAIDEMTELMEAAKSKADDANKFAKELETEIARMEAEERMLLMQSGYNQTTSSDNTVYTGNGTDYYYKTPYTYTEDELLLLAGIIEAEAGSSHYPGMVAVGSVVMNRIESPRYDNTIEGVIYAKGQFEPVRTGRLAVILARGPAVSCIGVAREVLDGKRNVPNLAFKAAWYAEEHGIEGVNIGGNVFH